ncbi:hypothetical protein bcgnr5411_25250 [Bacillus cereus]
MRQQLPTAKAVRALPEAVVCAFAHTVTLYKLHSYEKTMPQASCDITFVLAHSGIAVPFGVCCFL